tara:strand:+ start:2737 stop:2985 length:249 start_codon:yes stop_codon:yes gene_type:complete
MSELNDAVEIINELNGEQALPKNIKKVLQEVKDALLNDAKDFSLRIDNAKEKIADISEDPNLQSFSRTQIWNLSSVLEEIEA